MRYIRRWDSILSKATSFRRDRNVHRSRPRPMARECRDESQMSLSSSGAAEAFSCDGGLVKVNHIYVQGRDCCMLPSLVGFAPMDGRGMPCKAEALRRGNRMHIEHVGRRQTRSSLRYARFLVAIDQLIHSVKKDGCSFGFAAPYHCFCVLE